MPELYRGRDVYVLGRGFKLSLITFSNGCFLAVSEGSEERIGALIMSVKLKEGVKSTMIIPARYGSVFSTILAETAANILQGVAVISLYLISELDIETAKGLLGEVKDFLK